MKENTVRARSDVSSNDYANPWRTAIKQSSALSGHLPVPRERAINGGSTVEVSPDFAFLYDCNQKSFQTVLD